MADVSIKNEITLCSRWSNEPSCNAELY